MFARKESKFSSDETRNTKCVRLVTRYILSSVKSCAIKSTSARREQLGVTSINGGKNNHFGSNVNKEGSRPSANSLSERVAVWVLSRKRMWPLKKRVYLLRNLLSSSFSPSSLPHGPRGAPTTR